MRYPPQSRNDLEYHQAASGNNQHLITMWLFLWLDFDPTTKLETFTKNNFESNRFFEKYSRETSQKMNERMEIEAKHICIKGAIALSNIGVNLLEKGRIAAAIDILIDSTVVLRQGLAAPLPTHLGVPAFLYNAEMRAFHSETNASSGRIPARGVSFADQSVLSLLCEQSGVFYPICIADSDALWETDSGLLSSILFYNLGVAFLCGSCVRDENQNQLEQRNQAIHFFKVAICLIHGAGVNKADAVTLLREKVVKLAILHSLLPIVSSSDDEGLLFKQVRQDLTAEYDELVRAVKEIGGLLEGSTGNNVAVAA